jgi:hypothetical protein
MFVSSAVFGIVIAIAYWIVAREPLGVLFLGIMAAALFFAATYAVVAERDADLASDEPDADRAEAAGEDLGIFTTHSAYPILIALCILGGLIGIVWSPLLAVVCGIGLLLCLWRLGAESARV